MNSPSPQGEGWGEGTKNRLLKHKRFFIPHQPNRIACISFDEMLDERVSKLLAKFNEHGSAGLVRLSGTRGNELRISANIRIEFYAKFVYS